jgi:hypothetical protein
MILKLEMSSLVLSCQHGGRCCILVRILYHKHLIMPAGDIVWKETCKPAISRSLGLGWRSAFVGTRRQNSAQTPFQPLHLVYCSTKSSKRSLALLRPSYPVTRRGPPWYSLTSKCEHRSTIWEAVKAAENKPNSHFIFLVPPILGLYALYSPVFGRRDLIKIAWLITMVR